MFEVSTSGTFLIVDPSNNYVDDSVNILVNNTLTVGTDVAINSNIVFAFTRRTAACGHDLIS